MSFPKRNKRSIRVIDQVFGFVPQLAVCERRSRSCWYMIFCLGVMTVTLVIEMMEMRQQEVSDVAEDRDQDRERVRFLASGYRSRV